VHPVLKDFKQAYNSIRKEILYSILFEFCIQMKMVMLIEMRVHEAYSKVRLGKHLSDTFPNRNGLKKEMSYRYSFSTFLWSIPLGEFR
jgi:hypothetical protein